MTKTCTKCKCSKPLADFGAHKLGKNGLHPSCKECVNLTSKEWKSKNIERRRATSLAWNLANPEKIKLAKQKYAATESGRLTVNKSNTKYREKNPEKVKAWAAKYEESHPEAKAARSAYRRANLAKGRVNQNNRRARQLAAQGTHTPDDIKNIFRLQRGKCACCKVKIGGNYHVDHVMPLSKNGGNGVDNIQLLCPSCNVQKQARDPIKFMQSRGFLL